MIPGTGNLFPNNRNIIPSYDFVDIASGTGYISFDGVYTDNGSYVLIDSSLAILAGNDNFTMGTCIAATNANAALDIDFNLSPFQLPRSLEGDVLVGFSMGNESNLNKDITTQIKIRKWDGSNETEIANATTSITSIPGDSYRSMILKITCPKTHFKKGDQLRITVITSGGGVNDAILTHNPENTQYNNSGATTIPAGSTRFIVAVPFKIDI